jgi:hypothetical protein
LATTTVTADGHRERPAPQSGFLLVADALGVKAVDEHHPCTRRLAAGALLADGQGWIQRDHDQVRSRRRQQRDDEFRVTGGAQRDPITRQQATSLQLTGQVVNQSDQVAVADRYAI